MFMMTGAVFDTRSCEVPKYFAWTHLTRRLSFRQAVNIPSFDSSSFPPRSMWWKQCPCHDGSSAMSPCSLLPTNQQPLGMTSCQMLSSWTNGESCDIVIPAGQLLSSLLKIMPGSDVWLTFARTRSLARYSGGTLTICIELMHAIFPGQGTNARVLFRVVLNLSTGDITLSNEVKTPGCKSASIPDVASPIKHFIGAHRLLMQANFPTHPICLLPLQPGQVAVVSQAAPPSCSFSLSGKKNSFHLLPKYPFLPRYFWLSFVH